MKYFCCLLFAALISVTLASVDPRPRIKLTKKGVYPAGSTTPSPSRGKNDNSAISENDSKPAKTKFYARPESLDGWLTEPKPQASKIQTRSPPGEKPGYCDHLQNYGIQCGVRVDQCKEDKDCPNVTKCCLVSDCGFLCVKPFDKMKPAKNLKKKSIEEISKEADEEESKIAVTTAEGLKVNDITVIVPT